MYSRDAKIGPVSDNALTATVISRARASLRAGVWASIQFAYVFQIQSRAPDIFKSRCQDTRRGATAL
jgi:hypothetical protein